MAVFIWVMLFLHIALELKFADSARSARHSKGKVSFVILQGFIFTTWLNCSREYFFIVGKNVLLTRVRKSTINLTTKGACRRKRAKINTVLILNISFTLHTFISV